MVACPWFSAAFGASLVKAALFFTSFEMLFNDASASFVRKLDRGRFGEFVTVDFKRGSSQRCVICSREVKFVEIEVSRE